MELLEKGYRALFSRTSDLVQKLQVARRELTLEAAILRLERFDLLVLDDLAYVAKDQAETSVLFELISARYERRSLLITANQLFGEWGKVFPDPAMTLAVVDRLVHHDIIFEMNVESYRRRTAIERKQHGAGRPAQYATAKNLSGLSLRDIKPAREARQRQTTSCMIVGSRHRLSSCLSLPSPRSSRYSGYCGSSPAVRHRPAREAQSLAGSVG